MVTVVGRPRKAMCLCTVSQMPASQPMADLIARIYYFRRDNLMGSVRKRKWPYPIRAGWPDQARLADTWG